MGGSVCLRVQFLVSALRSLFGRDVQNIVCRSGSGWLGHALGLLGFETAGSETVGIRGGPGKLCVALCGSRVLEEALGGLGGFVRLCEALGG